ncbi:unnamed protein product [Prunus armeniaca]
MSAGSGIAGNCRKTAGFYPDFPELVPAIPATKSCDQGMRRQLDLRIEFRPDFGMRFRPLPVSFWGTSKNKSDSKLGVLPRVGVLSRDLWFFRRCDIALDTHALPARVAARGHCSGGAFLSQWDPQVVMSA